MVQVIGENLFYFVLPYFALFSIRLQIDYLNRRIARNEADQAIACRCRPCALHDRFVQPLPGNLGVPAWCPIRAAFTTQDTIW